MPVSLRCYRCKKTFFGPASTRTQECPYCGYRFGHIESKDNENILQQAKNKRVCDMTSEELDAVIKDASAKLKDELESPQVAAAMKQVDAIIEQKNKEAK